MRRNVSRETFPGADVSRETSGITGLNSVVVLSDGGAFSVFSNGVLQTAPSMANIGRTLEATQWVFHFEKKTQVAI